MIKLIQRFRTPIFYIIFGVITTFINLTVFYLLKKSGMTATDEGNTLANAIAWVSAVVFAFVANKIWVFRSKVRSLKGVFIEAVEFIGARIFSGIFEIVLPTPLSHVFGDGHNISLGSRTIHLDGQWEGKLFVSVLVIILNYIFSRFIVFRKKNKT